MEVCMLTGLFPYAVFDRWMRSFGYHLVPSRYVGSAKPDKLVAFTGWWGTTPVIGEVLYRNGEWEIQIESCGRQAAVTIVQCTHALSESTLKIRMYHRSWWGDWLRGRSAPTGISDVEELIVFEPI